MTTACCWRKLRDYVCLCDCCASVHGVLSPSRVSRCRTLSIHLFLSSFYPYQATYRASTPVDLPSLAPSALPDALLSQSHRLRGAAAGEERGSGQRQRAARGGSPGESKTAGSAADWRRRPCGAALTPLRHGRRRASRADSGAGFSRQDEADDESVEAERFGEDEDEHLRLINQQSAN